MLNKPELPEGNENPVRGPEFNGPRTELSIFLPKLNEALAAPRGGSALASGPASVFSDAPSALFPWNKNADSCSNCADASREGGCVSAQPEPPPPPPCCCSMPARCLS